MAAVRFGRGGAGLMLGASQDMWDLVRADKRKYQTVYLRWMRYPELSQWLDVQIPEALPINTHKNDNYISNADLAEERKGWQAKYNNAIETENRFLERFAFNPYSMSDAERDAALRRIVENMKVGGTVPAVSLINPSVPEAGSSALAQLAADRAKAGKTGTAANAGITGYLPYVGVGLAAFKLFFR